MLILYSSYSWEYNLRCHRRTVDTILRGDWSCRLLQVWGGPGNTAVTDIQKSVAGHSFVGDAATAASAMADEFSGSQKSSVPLELRNVLPSVSGSENDPLTLYLAKMSKHQLNDVMLEMKALAERNEATAKQLLQGSPQLRKALFQAQIMLGMVTPQMMQMASSQKSHFAVQDDKLDLNPVTPHPGQVPSHKEAIAEAFFQPPEVQVTNLLLNSEVFQHSSPQYVPLPAHLPSLPQNQIPLQGTTSGIAGIPMQPNLQASQLPPAIVSVPVAQPSLTHHFKPVGTTGIGQQPQLNAPITSLQQSPSSHPSTSQFSPEEEAVLLQQLMRLTPEQLSSLPLDKQQQVLLIQRIFRG